MMVARDHFDDKDNVEKINGLIEKTSKYQGIPTQSLAKKILFIVNNSQNLDISEESLQKKKNSLIKNIGLTQSVSKDINITFFNGLFYQYYLQKKYYFSNLEYLFGYTIQKHSEDYEKFQKGYNNSSSVEKKFENYLIRNLKDNLKTIFGINVNQIDSKAEIDKETDDTINSIISQKKLSFREKDLKDIKKIITYCKNNIDQCKYINASNFLNFRFYLYARITICKYESDNELRKLINNNLDNLNKIFYNEEDLKLGEKPVYIEITNESEKQLSSFERDIESKIKDIKLDRANYNVPEILENSIYDINCILKELKGKIDENLKKKKNWKDIQDEFEKTFHSTVEKEKSKIINNLEKCSEQIKIHYEEAFQIINKFKANPDDSYKYDELKIYISNKLGEKNNYKEAIDNIVNDIVTNSRTVTSWKNSSGLFDYLKSKIFDKAYLNKTIDFIISDAEERLRNFRKNIFYLTEEYQEIVLNNINIEKINIINVLEEKKRKKELENIENEKKNEEERKRYEKLKKKKEEKNRKWNKICEEYNTVKLFIDNIFNETEITETQTTPGDSETTTPQ